MTVLGIDPGLATVGWAVIKQLKDNRLEIRDYGVIKTPSKKNFGDRLVTISQELKKIINKHNPDSVAVEELFFAKNVKTAINVGHARGVILLSCAEMGLPISEFTPLQVKQAVTGFGRADKTQIGKMLQKIFNLQEIPKPDDICDALAIALCHINSCKINRLTG